jgi:RimJ/RimL family protein N-acetyltransferase
MRVEPMTVANVDRYIRLVSAIDKESGVDGAAHSHPYSADEPLDLDNARSRELTRWSTDTDCPGWRRAWGLFERDEIVGYVYLAGGALRSELHRAEIGLGVLRSHRRQGGGTQLLETAIAWAQRHPAIDWIDLGVFSDNSGARALYSKTGFRALGRTPDRYRIDGYSVDDTWMTRNVAQVGT